MEAFRGGVRGDMYVYSLNQQEKLCESLFHPPISICSDGGKYWANRRDTRIGADFELFSLRIPSLLHCIVSP